LTTSAVLQAMDMIARGLSCWPNFIRIRPMPIEPLTESLSICKGCWNDLIVWKLWLAATRQHVALSATSGSLP
jgi:hypothetical protein